MKNLIMSLGVLALLAVLGSCKKTRCAECHINTNAPGTSQSKSYCGTEEEISQEDNRLENDCVVLQAAYPQYYYNCGCN